MILDERFASGSCGGRCCSGIGLHYDARATEGSISMEECCVQQKDEELNTLTIQ